MLSSFQNRIILLIIGIIVFLTAALSAVIGLRAGNDFKKEAGTALSNTAYQMASRLDQYMWGRTLEVRILSEIPLLKRQGDPSEVERLLNKLMENYPSSSWLGMTDSNGKVLAGTDGILVGQSLAKRPVYVEGIKGEFIGDVHDAVLLANLLPNPTGEPMKFVDISVPIKDYENKTIGVLVAHLSWKWASQLEQGMFKMLKDRAQEEIFIVSQLDNVVLLGPKEMLGKKLELESVKKAQAGEVSWVQEYWPDGKEYITGFAFGSGYLDFKGLGWTVLVRKPIDVAYVTVYRLQIFIWSIGIFFTLIFAMIGSGMAGSIAKPLREIAKAADQLRFGGTVKVPGHKGIKELEIVADSLRELIQTVSERDSQLRQMENMAFYDRLTGLQNRLGLEKFMENAQTFIDEHQDFLMVILYMDLDGFKSVNDTYGHQAGDVVLKEVARRLKGNIREGELAVRIGGDEFVAILLAEKGKEQVTAGKVAKRIIDDINMPILIEKNKVTVGCSVGCTFWSGGAELKEAMETADKALYIVKKAGKNQYKVM